MAWVASVAWMDGVGGVGGVDGWRGWRRWYGWRGGMDGVAVWMAWRYGWRGGMDGVAIWMAWRYGWRGDVGGVAIWMAEWRCRGAPGEQSEPQDKQGVRGSAPAGLRWGFKGAFELQAPDADGADALTNRPTSVAVATARRPNVTHASQHAYSKNTHILGNAGARALHEMVDTEPSSFTLQMRTVPSQ
jgi:hypothetical protein